MKPPHRPKPTSHFIPLVALCSGLLFLSGCGGEGNSQVSQQRPPNIVLIMADDLGYGDLGCYGQQAFETPNLDALAAEGIRYTQFYAGSTVCAPSRASLLTGLHTGNAFTSGNVEMPTGGQLPIPPGTPTLQGLLSGAGYATGCFGKWGLGNGDTEGNPLLHGFDTFFGYHDQVLAHNSFPEFLVADRDTVWLGNDVQYEADSLWHRGLGSTSSGRTDYANDLILERALEFTAVNRDRPFFLYLPTTIPHMNDEAAFDDRFEVPEPHAYSDREWSPSERDYAGLVARLDRHVGQLRRHLDSLGLTENTLVLFTSDNGPVATGRFESTGGLRGIKRDLYEGGIRVPLIISWPGTIQPGVSERPAAAWDLLPSLAGLAGIEIKQPTDGVSLLPEWLGKGPASPSTLYWEFTWDRPTRQALRDGNWKAVKDGPDASLELYNLQDDPGETKDLATTHPEVAARMEYLITKHQRQK